MNTHSNRYHHSHDGAHVECEGQIIINDTLAGTIEENERGWTAIINGDEYLCACWEQAVATILAIYREANQ